MQAQLAQIARELAHAEQRLERIARIVPGDRWNVRNDPDHWSVGECIAHLNLTSEAYLPRIWTAIAEARELPRLTGRRYRRDPIGWLFSRLVGPLPSFAGKRIGRVKTTAAFIPAGREPYSVLTAEFKRLQGDLAHALRESDGLQIDRISILSPFGDKVRYNCYSALSIIPPHQERHLDQAELVWQA